MYWVLIFPAFLLKFTTNAIRIWPSYCWGNLWDYPLFLSTDHQALLSQRAMVEAEHGFPQTSNFIRSTCPAKLVNMRWVSDLSWNICFFPQMFAFEAREGISEYWMWEATLGNRQQSCYCHRKKAGLQGKRMKVDIGEAETRDGAFQFLSPKVTDDQLHPRFSHNMIVHSSLDSGG